MKKFSFLIIFLAFGLHLMAQNEKGDILIRNGNLITISGDELESTDILIKDGIIKQIGKDIKAKGVKEIQASGMYVMPGIIDAHSHLGIDAVNEGTNPVTPEVWVGDALNPYDIGIYRALAGGVTISHAMHGSANAIGGQCETIKHRYGVKNPNSLRMAGATRTIKFALGENPMRVHGEGNKIVPNTRMGVEQVFRESFAEAKDYLADWKAYNSGHSKVPPEYSLRKETVGAILTGDILIHCHSYRADEILMLMNVLKDYG